MSPTEAGMTTVSPGLAAATAARSEPGPASLLFATVTGDA
jgi:hypothetical protein